jgi:hypothetical protein
MSGIIGMFFNSRADFLCFIKSNIPIFDFGGINSGSGSSKESIGSTG